MTTTLKNKSIDNLNPKDRFLLKIANNPSQKLNYDGADFEKVVESALMHQVIPYLYHAFKDINSIPKTAKEKIEEYYQFSVTKNKKIESALKKILITLEEHNIKCIILKGLYLSKNIYPHPDLRPFRDVDILIKEIDVKKTIKCLEDMGFKIFQEHNEFLEKKDFRKQIHMINNGVVIDLHWEVINGGLYATTTRYKADEIFQNSREETFLDHKILTMVPDELIIYQAFHLASHHSFQRMIWFFDLKYSIEKYSKDINWDNVVSTAKNRKLSTQLYYALLFTNKLTDVNIPKEAMDQLRPNFLLARLFEFLIRKKSILEIRSNRKNITFQLWYILRDGWYLTLKAIKWRLFPNIDYFLYYYPFLPKIPKILYVLLYPVLLILQFFIRLKKQ